MDVTVGLWRKLAPKDWYFWPVVLEKTFESPFDCKEIQSVHPKGDQSWVFIGRTDAEAETPILWPPHVKSWLIGKDPDAGRDWGQEEKWMTEDEMAVWHHWLDEHEFEQTPGVGDGQGRLECYDSWGCKESTRLSDWTELNPGHWTKARSRLLEQEPIFLLSQSFPSGSFHKPFVLLHQRTDRMKTTVTEN